MRLVLFTLNIGYFSQRCRNRSVLGFTAHCLAVPESQDHKLVCPAASEASRTKNIAGPYEWGDVFGSQAERCGIGTTLRRRSSEYNRL